MDNIKNWLPSIAEHDIHQFRENINNTVVIIGKQLLTKYTDLIDPYAKTLNLYNNPREADCLASGIVFFYGCLIYIMHFPNWGNYIEDIFLYNLLYILVDHYIDDNSINAETKKIAIHQMQLLVHDPNLINTIEIIDPILLLIADTYNNLIIRHPNVKNSIINLFNAEIEGYNIQNSKSSNRNIYYDIALRKGGHTMQVLQNIIDDTNEHLLQSSFHIGTIMQLIDDCLDVVTDLNNNINTIATYDKENTCNLDNLLLDIIKRINNIDSRFTIFKIIYSVFVVYIPTRNKHDYTQTTINIATSLNLFDFDASDVLVTAVKSEAILR